MTEEQTQSLQDRLGRLLGESFKVSDPVGMLHLIREKIHVGHYQSFYKQEILDELGRLQRITRELNSEMLGIYELLKGEG